jgi:dTMP kinase
LISRFLRGEFGKVDEVNPYLVSLIYAGDRNDAAQQLTEWIRNGYMVIADRYLYSNIAFQCAKITGTAEKEKLARWIKYLEYEYYKIPIPDLNLFLNVPDQFTRTKLSEHRKGSDREYLNGFLDIHESDLSFQEKVREIYLWQVRENEDFEMIDCSDVENKMLLPREVSQIIINKIEHKNLKL